MKITIEIHRPGWMTPTRLRRARPLLLLLALVFAGPVLASDRFTDVPNSNIHHDNISAIAAANITIGCNEGGTRYCPGDPVTRQEMGSFLARTAGLGGNPPVTNADKLDGLDSTALQRRVTGTCAAGNSIRAVAADGSVTCEASGGDGTDGTDGVDGTDGTDGVDGVSALDAVPSGQTIRGAVGGDFHAYDATQASDFGVDVTLPMPAPVGLDDDDVFVSVAFWQGAEGQTAPTTTDTNAGCTGTLDEPTAPAGKVCIYVTGADQAFNLNGYSVRFGTEASRYGFKLKWDASTQGDTFVDAVWAYTAP